MNTFMLLVTITFNGITTDTVLDYNMTGEDCINSMMVMQYMEVGRAGTLSCEFDYATYEGKE